VQQRKTLLDPFVGLYRSRGRRIKSKKEEDKDEEIKAQEEEEEEWKTLIMGGKLP